MGTSYWPVYAKTESMEAKTATEEYKMSVGYRYLYNECLLYRNEFGITFGHDQTLR